MKFDRHGNIMSEVSAHTGREPTWENAGEMTSEEFRRKATDAIGFYTYYCDTKELNSLLVDWMKEEDYAKRDIALIRRYGDRVVSGTAGKVARCLSRGMPYAIDGDPTIKEQHLDYVTRSVVSGISQARSLKIAGDKTKTKTNVPVLTPMQHLEAKISENIIGPIEELLDAWTDGEPIEAFDVYAHMAAHGIGAKGCGFTKTYLEGILDELKEVKAGDDKELTESYSFLKKRQLNAIIKALQEMYDANEQYAIDKKVKRTRKPRVKKPRSAAKQTAKVQYLPECKEYCFKSLDPMMVLGANIVYLFNTKTRVMTKLQAESRNGLSIKGTSVKDYNEDHSFRMKIRKPQDLVNHVKGKKNSPKKMENLISKMKTAIKPARGRINQDTIILFASEK